MYIYHDKSRTIGEKPRSNMVNQRTLTHAHQEALHSSLFVSYLYNYFKVSTDFGFPFREKTIKPCSPGLSGESVITISLHWETTISTLIALIVIFALFIFNLPCPLDPSAHCSNKVIVGYIYKGFNAFEMLRWRAFLSLEERLFGLLLSAVQCPCFVIIYLSLIAVKTFMEL